MNQIVDIWGGAQTDFARNWTREGKNEVALLSEVIEDALEKTGLSFADIRKLNKKCRSRLSWLHFELVSDYSFSLINASIAVFLNDYL